MSFFKTVKITSGIILTPVFIVGFCVFALINGIWEITKDNENDRLCRQNNQYIGWASCNKKQFYNGVTFGAYSVTAEEVGAGFVDGVSVLVDKGGRATQAAINTAQDKTWYKDTTNAFGNRRSENNPCDGTLESIKTCGKLKP